MVAVASLCALEFFLSSEELVLCLNGLVKLMVLNITTYFFMPST
jgi:hypothetical protein